jgi:Domain of unknown function (DUF4263)
MSEKDFIMEFRNKISHLMGLCRVRIFLPSQEKSVVVITDIGDLNPGPSVTNSIENIVTILLEQKLINKSTIVIENYEPTFLFYHTYDIVNFDENFFPEWTNVTADEVANICGASELTVSSIVEDNINLVKQVISKGKLILQGGYNITGKKAHDTIKVYKKDIRHLIETKSGEREFQAVLKNDLSLIAEVYADPKNEYICFSEFPIANRKADFVLFTGRSKMSVFVFEVKGADFFFSNTGHYKKMNEKINTCKHQIVETISTVNKEFYLDFHSFCHKVRSDVEDGVMTFNSLMGAKKYLQVDPKKEIKIYGVIIGGRTRNEIYESKLRHNEERMGQNIIIESWNSWLNKLERPESLT